MIGSVKVVSKRWSGTQPDKGDIIIDADRTSRLLGNPYPMHDKSLSERDRVIAANNHRVDLDLTADGPISKELNRLAQLVQYGTNIALSCWCAPCQCHADRYTKEINKIVSSEKIHDSTRNI